MIRSVSVVGINGFVLLVNKNVPAKTLAEFIAYVRARPKIFSYAEGSAGSITHLGMALFLKRAGLEHFSIRLGVSRVCEISFAFFFGNPFEKRGDCSPKLLNSARLHFA